MPLSWADPALFLACSMGLVTLPFLLYLLPSILPSPPLAFLSQFFPLPLPFPVPYLPLPQSNSFPSPSSGSTLWLDGLGECLSSRWQVQQPNVFLCISSWKWCLRWAIVLMSFKVNRIHAENLLTAGAKMGKRHRSFWKIRKINLKV